MGYQQWVIVKITNSTNKALKIANLRLMYGKIHREGNKDEEISADDVDSTEIAPNATYTLCTCGRSDSPSGAEVALQLMQEQAAVCTLYWDCPWGSKTNNFEVQDRNKQYVVSAEGWVREGGALGTAEVEVFKKG
ncbi:pleurotolysin A [Coccidioides immitis RS]|uniref:Pleurotolysin A n=1 Tax=Coccidioides immitis (strain RS) TaxID=246410 RepID=J3K7L6_COCIM|nr:pleurotolysin A [Coccidioides immitis RS]EAS30705.3 pleurotolysin A [Coccidioides immitis RS]